jgi:hypothetical protein
MNLTWAGAVVFHVAGRPDLAAGTKARTGWIEPDLRPLPWSPG